MAGQISVVLRNKETNNCPILNQLITFTDVTTYC